MSPRRLLLRSAALLATLTLLAAAPAAGRAQQATPVTGTTVFELPGDNVFPEGVAYDPDTNTFFVGSTSDGTIFQGDLTTGDVTTFVSGGEITSAIGMKVDGNDHLIVAGGASGNVYVLDKSSGEVIATFTNGLGEGETFLNDVAVAPNGDVYITDSTNPVFYRIAAADIETGGDLEALVEFNGTALQYSDEGPNANGIVIDPTGEFAIVVQSGTGNLYKIGLSDGSVEQITINGENVTFGDGLWLDGQILYVVRNQLGVIARLQLDEGFTTADVLDTFTDPTLAFPTTIAKVDGQLLVVNAQFDRRESADPVLPFTVSLIDIPPLPTSGTPEATPVA